MRKTETVDIRIPIEDLKREGYLDSYLVAAKINGFGAAPQMLVRLRHSGELAEFCEIVIRFERHFDLGKDGFKEEP